MFTYFHQHKLSRDKKGQLFPLFIVILTVVLTMTMVTLNLSKVALIKTDTSNAADAAAIASGASMANLFNSVTTSSNQMREDAYIPFMVGYGIMLTEASAYMGFAIGDTITALTDTATALGLAYEAPGAAAGWVMLANVQIANAKILITGKEKKKGGGGKDSLTDATDFVGIIQDMMVYVGAFAYSQWMWYEVVRKNAIFARKKARQIGYSFAFRNSGIGGKLKPGVAPEKLKGDEDRKNYQSSFSKFSEDMMEGEDADDTDDPPPSYAYAWKDGQGRQHSVEVKVATQDVEGFELIHTKAPWPLIEGVLGAAMGFGYAASSMLTAIKTTNLATIDILWVAQGCMSCCGSPAGFGCCPCWGAASTAAATALGTSSGMLGATLGMEISGIITAYSTVPMLLPDTDHPMQDKGELMQYTEIICWIDDIDHDRRVQVETTQNHEGGDLTFWNTKYPVTYSYTIDSFAGTGHMGDPFSNSFDSDIIETDVIGQEETKNEAQ